MAKKKIPVPTDKNEWFATPKMLEQIAEFAGLGLSQEQIHNYYGITPSQWLKAIQRQPELVVAVCVGKSSAIAQVTGKLWQLIQRGDRHAICFYLDRQAGWLKSTNLVDSKPITADIPSIKASTDNPVEAARIYQKIMIGA